VWGAKGISEANLAYEAKKEFVRVMNAREGNRLSQGGWGGKLRARVSEGDAFVGQ